VRLRDGTNEQKGWVMPGLQDRLAGCFDWDFDDVAFGGRDQKMGKSLGNTPKSGRVPCSLAISITFQCISTGNR
jgi:hypothetical protein